MKSKIIGLFNQKGGVGKSTITTMMATYINQFYKYKIVAMDLDYPQHSLKERRDADLREIELGDPELEKEKFSKLKSPMFDIHCMQFSEATKLMDKIKSTEDFLVFADLPGTINNKEAIQFVNSLDVVIIPLAPSYLEFQATLPAIEIIKKISPKAQIVIAWSKVKSSETLAHLEAFDKYFKENFSECVVLDTKIKDLVMWKNGLSSIYPNPKIKSFVNEFMTKCNLNNQ